MPHKAWLVLAMAILFEWAEQPLDEDVAVVALASEAVEQSAEGAPHWRGDVRLAVLGGGGEAAIEVTLVDPARGLVLEASGEGHGRADLAEGALVIDAGVELTREDDAPTTARAVVRLYPDGDRLSLDLDGRRFDCVDAEWRILSLSGGDEAHEEADDDDGDDEGADNERAAGADGADVADARAYSSRRKRMRGVASTR